VANAFEVGQDVVVDAVVHPDPQIVDSARLPFRDPPSPPGRLVRVRLGADGKARVEELAGVGMEFPTVRAELDGVGYRYVYAGGLERYGRAALTATLLKVDTRTGKTASLDLGEDCVFGEPVFVPRRDGAASEDDGWVLSLAYDGSDHHSFLAIVRADTWEEVARVHLPFHVPMGLHASFVPA
jgi:all-trans-8'-apo-beta-carotenal 15,15'-oxygenase